MVTIVTISLPLFPAPDTQSLSFYWEGEQLLLPSRSVLFHPVPFSTPPFHVPSLYSRSVMEDGSAGQELLRSHVDETREPSGISVLNNRADTHHPHVNRLRGHVPQCFLKC